MLVFVQSIDRAKELFHELVYDGINVDVIHSERTQAQRDSIVAGFRTGRIWFLIATELLSRGMDFKGVNLVINYDFPQTTVSYIHRIGKGGGREARGTSGRRGGGGGGNGGRGKIEGTQQVLSPVSPPPAHPPTRPPKSPPVLIPTRPNPHPS